MEQSSSTGPNHDQSHPKLKGGNNKKRKYESLESLLEKPWCYYCEKYFVSLNELVDHQKKLHFSCAHCSRRLNTANGLVVHVHNVHKLQVERIENALLEREGTKPEIFAMQGIPEEIVQKKRDEIIADYKREEHEYKARTGNPLPGSAEAQELAERSRKAPRTEEKLDKADVKARVAAHIAAKKAAKKAEEEQGALAAAQPAQAPPVAFDNNSPLNSGAPQQDMNSNVPTFGTPGFPSLPTSNAYQQPPQVAYAGSPAPYAGAYNNYGPPQAPYGAPPMSVGPSPPPYGSTYGAPYQPGYAEAAPSYPGHSYTVPEGQNGDNIIPSPFGHVTKKRPSPPVNESRKSSLPDGYGLPQRPAFNNGAISNEVMKGLHLGYHATQDSMGGRGAYLPNIMNDPDMATDQATTTEFDQDDIDARINSIINGGNPGVTEAMAIRPAADTPTNDVPSGEARNSARDVPGRDAIKLAVSAAKKKLNTKLIVENSLSPEELRTIIFGDKSREKLD